MRWWVFSVLYVSLVGCQPTQAQVTEVVVSPPQRSFQTPKVVAAIKDARVKESSGVAASRQNSDWYYTHNDSGDAARIFRFDLKGNLLAEIAIPGAQAIDCEDIACAEVSDKATLYVGDIGDNARKRESVVVYRFPEPGKDGKVGRVDRLVLTYPDGPHDAETLMVSPKTGDLYIVEKAAGRPSKVFKCSPPATGDAKLVLKAIGQIQVGGDFAEAQMTTGGDISPDGKRVIVRTYLGAYEFTPSGDFDSWPSTKPVRVSTGLEAQGEAICYAADGKSLITTSEGSPCPITQIKLR